MSAVAIAARQLEAGTIAGIDVGEDYLDLAIIVRAGARLAYRRVALAGLERDPLGALRERIVAAAPELRRGRVLAIVDSPRWPRDRTIAGNRNRGIRHGRDVDLALRRLTAAIAATMPTLGRLSMYPTPPASYFLECIADTGCKPHLRALAAALFAPPRREQRGGRRRAGSAVSGGRRFTRFMIAGFAAYRALELLGVETCESFPDLQFRLAAPSVRLLPKRRGAAALAMRQRIVARLAQVAGIDVVAPATLDFADAAVLALAALRGAQSGQLIEIRSPAEGSFVVGLNSAQVNLHRPQSAGLTGVLAIDFNRDADHGARSAFTRTV